MGPNKVLPKTGHDVDGNIYKLKYNDKDEEISRIPTGERLIWTGGTANLGIKQFKRDMRKQGNDQYLINVFKENSWANPEMKRHIEMSALKSTKKSKKSA